MKLFDPSVMVLTEEARRKLLEAVLARRSKAKKWASSVVSSIMVNPTLKWFGVPHTGQAV